MIRLRLRNCLIYGCHKPVQLVEIRVRVRVRVRVKIDLKHYG
jgi:hypothetical protein